MEAPETLRQTVPLQPWGSRAQAEGTKCLSLVRVEFGIDLGLPCEGERDSLLPAKPFPGNTWAPRERQLKGTRTIQSLQLLLRMFTPHLGRTTGASGHNPALNVQQGSLPTCPPGHLPKSPTPAGV